MSRKMTRPVSLCSLMPRKRGCSPGAELSDSSFRLLTWEMDRTVAATNHGRPMMEHTASITPTISRSRWYPQPFCKTERGRQRSDQTGRPHSDRPAGGATTTGCRFCFAFWQGFPFHLTSSLCSFRLMMTAVICWSMKIRMVQRRAGMEAARTVHHGLGPIGLMNHPRSSLVGWWCPRE